MSRHLFCARAALAAALFITTGVACAGQISVRVNGAPLEFIGTGPQTVQGRVMVPLRGVLEKLGAHVGWNNSTQTVVASRDNLDLEMRIGSRVAKVNGREVTMDVPAMTIGGSTMVPLRFVGEALGAQVRWDNATETVSILTEGRREGTRTAGEENRRPEREVRRPEREPRRTPVTVTSLTHNHRGGWLKAGEPLTVTLRGTEGAEANFRVPGLVEEVRMQEISPGVYRGQWTVPSGKSLAISDVAVLGSLKLGSETAPLIQAGDTLRIDNTAPRIADQNPAHQAQVTKPRPLISATFNDQGGSGIVPDRVRILLDGRDVTAESGITSQFFTYTPRQQLAGGQHRVEVVAQDNAGNESRRAWEFDVLADQRGIEAIQTNASGDLKPGDILHVRVTGPPGGSATWSLGPSLQNKALKEDKPGIYVGNYRVREGDDVNAARLGVTIAMPDQRKITDTFGKAATIRTGPPSAPVVTFPKADDTLTNPLVVRGSAAPNSTVRLKIEYRDNVLNAIGVKGTLAQQDVPVDKDGKWASNPINLSSLLRSGRTEYTLTAVSISPTQAQSPITTLRFK